MKLFVTSLCFFAIVGSSVAAAAVTGAVTDNNDDESPIFRPLRMRFEDLLESQKVGSSAINPLEEAMTSVGMISITDMPSEFRRKKLEVLSLLHPCALMESAAAAATATATTTTKAKEHVFADGTRRLTFATHTTPSSSGGGAGELIGVGNAGIPITACQQLEEASVTFRHGVDEVTHAFAKTLSNLLGTTDDDGTSSAPLLKTSSGNRDDYRDFSEVVKQGEHLEHFHSYQKSTGTGKNDIIISDDDDNNNESTIEWHTDQGLFLVFTPGLMVQPTTSSSSSGSDSETTITHEISSVSDGFFVELPDGTRAAVELDESDDLVILLGDGIHQLANPILRNLRAVPHALSLSSSSFSQPDKARVWYGRMVLLPANALHPSSSVHGETFGQLRQQMIQNGENKEIMSLGCSSSSMAARQLEEASCEEGTLLCWHRCMSLEEYGVSDDVCADQGLDLECINPRNQLWDMTHGDWFPGCINASTAENATEYPKLPTYPRDDGACTKEAFVAFVENSMSSYEYQADLTNGGMLLWTVEDQNVNGMLIYNGLFGYTSLGFAGIPGGNLMHGAKVIMATPSESYSPVTGFNFSYDALVAEYIISTDSDEKAFRHWMTPVSAKGRAAGDIVSDISTYQVEETECFTAMTFKTPGIFNQTFNISGTDKLIWAANGEDSFAGYHGAARGVIDVEWSTGKVTGGVVDVPPEEDLHDDGHNDGDLSLAANEDASQAAASPTTCALWLISFCFLVVGFW